MNWYSDAPSRKGKVKISLQKLIEKIRPPHAEIVMQNPFLGVKTLKPLCNPSCLLQKSRKKHCAAAQQLLQLLQSPKTNYQSPKTNN
jgi:hypothetical protein